jgi:hypothetical protein
VDPLGIEPRSPACRAGVVPLDHEPASGASGNRTPIAWVQTRRLPVGPSTSCCSYWFAMITSGSPGNRTQRGRLIRAARATSPRLPRKSGAWGSNPDPPAPKAGVLGHRSAAGGLVAAPPPDVRDQSQGRPDGTAAAAAMARYVPTSVARVGVEPNLIGLKGR